MTREYVELVIKQRENETLVEVFTALLTLRTVSSLSRTNPEIDTIVDYNSFGVE